MTEFLIAARDGEHDEMQRLIGEGASVHKVELSSGTNALMYAAYNDNAHVVLWLLKEGGARLVDVNARGWIAFAIAANRGHYSLVECMLKESGALITNVTFGDGGKSIKTVWNSLMEFPGFASNVSAELSSLLKVMVLLDDAPTDFITKLLPQNTDVVTQGRQIRTLRPSYLVHQLASVSNESPLPSVLLSIVVAYAKPTSEDMWTDCAMDVSRMQAQHLFMHHLNSRALLEAFRCAHRAGWQIPGANPEAPSVPTIHTLPNKFMSSASWACTLFFYSCLESL
jgi:ankyrin repeat protein